MQTAFLHALCANSATCLPASFNVSRQLSSSGRSLHNRKRPARVRSEVTTPAGIGICHVTRSTRPVQSSTHALSGQGSSVAIVTELWAGRAAFDSRQEQRVFSSLPRPIGSGAHPPMGTGDSLPGVRRP